MPLQRGAETTISPSVKNMLSDNEAFKEYLMQFAKEADFNISDIKVKKMAALLGIQWKQNAAWSIMFFLKHVKVLAPHAWLSWNR